MNFEQVRQGNGANVTLNVVANRIDGTSFIPSGTAKQDCQFTDANGENQKVTIWQGKGQPMPTTLVQQTVSLSISCKQKGTRINYGGFWNANAQTQPINTQAAPQQASQDAPQPAQPVQSPPLPPNTPILLDAAQIRRDIVCAYMRGGVEPDMGKVIYWTDYIATGNIPVPPCQNNPIPPEMQEDYGNPPA